MNGIEMAVVGFGVATIFATVIFCLKCLHNYTHYGSQRHSLRLIMTAMYLSDFPGEAKQGSGFATTVCLVLTEVA
ncbi:MAG: hypothetical protein H6963_12850 [Chromatiaceae bacterium]|nr:hypothetical protein [Chromatiaceae bacterium]